MKNISEIIKKKNLIGDPRNKYEYQAYGNKLADEFGDNKHRALYIKLAKNEDRTLLEMAREFVLGTHNATTKGRLFMWKLAQLKKERKETEKMKELKEQED